MTYIRLIDADKEARQCALRGLLVELICKYFLRPCAEKSEAPEWLRVLRDRLREDNHFAEGSACISRLTDKSREHIARSMKKYYGVTVSEYINDLRLSYIASMLRYSNHSILDIIFESGFNNVSWCYQCFKEKYGMSMASYRSHVLHESAP